MGNTSSHLFLLPSSTAAARKAFTPACFSPSRHTRNTGDRGTGATSGRSTAPGISGASTTVRTGVRCFAMIRRNSSRPTAIGAGPSTAMDRPAKSCRANAVHSCVRGCRPRVHALPGERGERHLRAVGQGMVVRQQDSHRLVPHQLTPQPGAQPAREPVDVPEGHVEPACVDLPGRTGQTALEPRHQLTVRREFTGARQHPPGGQPLGVEVHEQRPRHLGTGGEQVVLRRQHPPGVRQKPLAVPVSATRRVVLTKSSAPNSRSRRRMSRLRACWATYSRAAARVKWSSSAAVTKARRSRGSMSRDIRRIQQHGCVNGHR